jgi:hypothetical protein
MKGEKKIIGNARPEIAQQAPPQSRKGFKESKKVTRNKALLETMAIMNEEIHRLTNEMATMMNFNATILEVAELNGLFSTQDVLQLMGSNVKNSSVFQMIMTEMDGEKTDDISGLSEILGQQLYDHNLDINEIRKDIIDFKQFYKGDDIDELITKAEQHRRELTSMKIQEDNEEV